MLKSSSFVCKYYLHKNIHKNFYTTVSHDVTICGGGVVGSLLAALILHHTSGHCNIGIIESSIPSENFKAKDEVPDMRVYALSPLSVKVLKEIDAWKYIEPRSQPYRTMQIWESKHPGYLRLSGLDLNIDQDSEDMLLGYICEDRTIQTAIYQSIKDRGYPLTTYYNSTVSDISLPNNTIGNNIYNPALVKISSINSDIHKVSTRLLVGADGGQSTVRKLGGFSTWGWSYDQEAIVATVQIDVDKDPHYDNSTAWQKYLPTGPIALLPLWDNYASIVWSTSIAEAKRLKGLNKELFLRELNDTLQSNYKESTQNVNKSNLSMLPPFIQNIINTEISGLKDIILAAAHMNDALKLPPLISNINSKVISFPLSFSQSKPYVKPRCVLIGDAAHSIHPQAGQGLNLGVQDAISLSSSIISSIKIGNDIGDIHQTLLNYEQDRALKNLSMITIVDVINRMFKDHNIESNVTNDTLLDHFQLKFHELRTLGLLGIHNIKPLKQKIAKFATGLESIHNFKK